MNLDPHDHIMSQAVQLIAKMPGIGKRTAQRLAFFILAQNEEYALNLSEAIRKLKTELRTCRNCFHFCHRELCVICESNKRDNDILCIVEDTLGLNQIEESGHFQGLYHVLQGCLSPGQGIGPNELRIKELLERLKTFHPKEIILATNPTLEGEATANYLADLLIPTGILITRIATGVPMGGSLDYVDSQTMSQALDHRRPIDQH